MNRIPLILLPGMPLDAALWEHQTRHLADVAEGSVGTITQADSIAELARLVLARAPARFALAGLSMGGYVALEIMRQAPERVLKLALLDTNARPDTAEQTANRRAAIELARQGKMRHVMAGMVAKLIHPDRLAERALVDSIHAQAERIGPEAYARQQTAIMGRADSRLDLPAIRCPTAVICGRQDALTPPELHVEMADAIPGARFLPIEECGHLAPMERPQAVTALLREWLVYA
ncbi:MAG TPA: alpha/beta fold hydrolase [Azospirillum sp.]